MSYKKCYMTHLVWRSSFVCVFADFQSRNYDMFSKRSKNLAGTNPTTQYMCTLTPYMKWVIPGRRTPKGY